MDRGGLSDTSPRNSSSSESEEVEESSSSALNPASGNVGRNSRSCFAKATPHADAVHLNTFLQRESKRMARNPCIYLWVSMLITLALSAIGLIAGDFRIEVENEGWWSRGTLQSSRQRQANLVSKQRFNLAYNESAWDIWTDTEIKHTSYEKLLYSAPFFPNMTELEGMEDLVDTSEGEDPLGDARSRSLNTIHKLIQQKVDQDEGKRRLDEEASGNKNILAGCDTSFYKELSSANLWPIWEIPKKEYESTDTRSILDPDVLEAICIAETNTQNFLEENDLCDTENRCPDSGKCIPPYSVVLVARLLVEGGLEATANGQYVMDCKGLANAWTPELQEETRGTLIDDIKELKIFTTPGSNDGNEKVEPEFLYGYYPALVQADFDTNGGRSQITSSIFDTASVANTTELYDVADSFDRAKDSDGILLGSYDNGRDGMAELKSDSLVGSDMTLALGSAFVIMVAIMLHTQSPLISGLGLLQIFLSFPMAYFFYALLLQYRYFPFLNFLGLFVVFALGAGDIYVAFDKWTNYRKNNMTKSTEYIAAYALPESLSAMFLTTITTALAFFATVVCPVAPIKMFAIFCGLLILLDYLLCCLFIFPGLCIYDRALIKRAAQEGSISACWGGCLGCGTCFTRCTKTDVYDDVVIPRSDSQRKGSTDDSSTDSEEEDGTEDFKTENFNFAQELMLKTSDYLNRARWPLLAICLVSFGICIYFSLQLTSPESSDVRLLRENIQYERNYVLRKELLQTELDNLGGSRNTIIFGLDPVDTGVASNPFDGTALVLDETFDPSSEEAQIYLKGYCDDLFAQDFAEFDEDDYVCPINQFDEWLKNETSVDSTDPLFMMCGSPDGLPVASDKFNDCLSAWALRNQNFDIISRDGVVKIMRIPFRNKAVFTDRMEVLQEQADAINEWLETSNEKAPEVVNNAYFTGLTFHWHDTNSSIQRSAYGAALIALALSAFVILFSSYSVVLTLFSTATILFILVSVTSFLVAFGWTLGFLESICFSILIGISVDFVIHFNHAYVHYRGVVSREKRTRYAMITMGPSILATAGTTFFSAIVMLFCTITFFNKFALVLFFTVVMATFASFVFFITLTNCFGPTNPTYLVEKFLSIIFCKDHEPLVEGKVEEEDAFESKSPRKKKSSSKPKRSKEEKDEIKLLEKKLWKSERAIIKAQIEDDHQTLKNMEKKRLKYQTALVKLMSVKEQV